MQRSRQIPLSCLLILFLSLPSSLLQSLAFAQNANLDDGIWLAAHDNADSPPAAPNSPTVDETDNALKSWIALQTGLYDVAMQFDEQAAAMQKHLPAFEKYVLERQNDAIRNGENVDKILYTPSNMPAKTQIQFQAVAAEPTLCAKLDAALKNYVATSTPALESTIATLVRTTKDADDEQKRDISKRLAVANAAIANRKRAQEILYLCIYKLKSETGKSRDYSVERTMRQWYRIQLPILDAWLGNVD